MYDCLSQQVSRSNIVLDVQGDLIDLLFDRQSASKPSFYSAYEHALLLAEVSRYLVTSFIHLAMVLTGAGYSYHIKTRSFWSNSWACYNLLLKPVSCNSYSGFVAISYPS